MLYVQRKSKYIFSMGDSRNRLGPHHFIIKAALHALIDKSNDRHIISSNHVQSELDYAYWLVEAEDSFVCLG